RVYLRDSASPRQDGSASLPVQSIQPQITAVTSPKAPATNPIARGPAICDAIPPPPSTESSSTIARIPSWRTPVRESGRECGSIAALLQDGRPPGSQRFVARGNISGYIAG